MKQLKNLAGDHGVHLLIAILSIALLLVLLWTRLGSLTGGNAASIEIASRVGNGGWRAIVDNPLNAPYSAVQWLVGLTGHHGITSLRLVSTLFGGLAAVLFYFVARQWHRMRVALLASWLFVTSAWFLHVARLGSPEILWLVSMLLLVVLLTPNRNGRQTSLALPSTLLLLSTVLYVPGMVWLVAVAVLLQRKNIREAWQATSAGWLRLLSIVGSAGLLAPLAYAFQRSPGLITPWLGLPSGSAPDMLAPLTILHNFVTVPLSIVFRSSFDAAHWLAHLPLLSAFEIIMLLLGVYFYATHMRAARTRLILSLAGIGWLLVAIMGLNAISLVVPVIYLLVAAGIAYILHLWLKVFPNNPIARTFGITAVLFAVLLTSVYQTRSYFIAWRYNSDTVQTFQTKL